MKDIFKFLGLGVGVAAASLFFACSSGTTNPNESEDAGPLGTGGSASTGTGTGTGSGTGGTNTNTDACTPKVLYNFSNDLQGFIFSNVVEKAPYVNLVMPGDAGVVGNPPQLGWASKDYDGAAVAPNAGSMMIEATFSNWNQKVAAEVNGPADSNNNPIDLSNMILSAKVMLVKGLSSNQSAPGGIVFYVKTGSNYDWGQATWQNLTSPGSWIDVKFDTAHPDSGSSKSFNPAIPIQMGFSISSGGGGTVGAFGSTALDTIVYIDQVTMKPNTCI